MRWTHRLTLFPLALVLSCGITSPDLPTSDFRLSGAYVYGSSEGGALDDFLVGSQVELFAGGGWRFTNPGFSDEEHGEFDIVESGDYSFSASTDTSGLLVVDITSQYPSKVASAYTFGGGFNRMRYRHYYDQLLGEEYLELKIPRGSKEVWATFTGRIPPALEGDYTSLGSTNSTWDRRLEDAAFSFAADSAFLLTNPIDLSSADGETTVVITESGTFSVGTESIRFSVYDQQPTGWDSLYLLSAPQTSAGFVLEEGRLTLIFSGEGSADTTYWKPPGTIEEIEPNDSRETATVLGGPGSYVAVGRVDSGGIVGETYGGDYDYFKVTAGATGTLSLYLTWEEAADLDMILFDSNGADLDRSDLYGQTPPESIAATVEGAADYYVLIVSFDNPASYTLTATVP